MLHYLAIASAAEVPWTIDDFERIRKRVPVLCNLKPSGDYVAVDLHRAGGVPQVLKMLLTHGVLHGDCMTITGRHGRSRDGSVGAARDHDFSGRGAPMYAEGHLAMLHGTWRPRCVEKITGLKNRRSRDGSRSRLL